MIQSFEMSHPSLVSAVLAAVGLLGTAAPVSAQWQKNQHQQESAAAQHLHPAPLVARCRPTRPAGDSPRVLRLRIYADGDYRAAAGPWQDRMRGLLADMNQVLTPALGVRLEVEAFRRWDRPPGAGTLPPVMDQLRAMDDGQEVDWVVGLISALPLMSQSFHDLGLAVMPGRHLLVRGVASPAELEHLRQAFPTLNRAQREELYARRQNHKERAIFLHEWAHTLGLGHSDRPGHIMSPGYSPRTGLLEQADCAKLAAALDRRPPPARRGGAAADPTLPRLPRPGALPGRP